MTEPLDEDHRPAEGRSEKVKLLEDKIKKLEKENKKLLHKVHDSPSPDRARNRAPPPNAGIQNGVSGGIDEEDDLENGLLDLQRLVNEDDFREDEWLYVSPKLPPTPVQKKVTPHQWLSEGHDKDGGAGEDVPSIDDVRKNLMYNIDEAENLGDMPSYNQTSSLKRRPAAANRASQRTEDKPKQRTRPSPNHRPGSVPSDDEEEEVVLVVKWKAKVPAEEPSSLSLPSEPTEEDAVPARKWKVKQVPASSSGGFDDDHDRLEIAAEESLRLSPQHSRHRQTRIAQRDEQGGGVNDVPVVKWKAKVPDQQSPSDVPVVNWKAKAPPQETVADVPVVRRAKIPVQGQGSDVPVVKWKAKAPSEGEESPVMRRKARVPEEATGSDVPVVKWKAKAPSEGEEAPVRRRKAKMPEDATVSDVPVVKWKAKAPEDGKVVRRVAKMPEEVQASDVPVVKWKAKVPEDAQHFDMARKKARVPPQEAQQTSDVPVVKWRAKAPEDGPSPNSHFGMRKKAKMPAEDGQSSNHSSAAKKRAKLPEDPQVPVVKWKAKMPQANGEASEVPVGTNPVDSSVETQKQPSTKSARSPRKVATVPDEDINTDENTQMKASQSNSHESAPSLTPPHSPVNSSTELPQSEPVGKPLSRRSSFSEHGSRSPSPPSISPHVRMAIASPILSRRTPSPSRSLAGSMGSLNTSRQSPNASPVPHRKHLQYIGGGQSPATTNRAFAGIPSPVSGSSGGHVSRIRTPRSQQQSKTSSPMKGITPPGERKHKRVLPSGPEFAGKSHDQLNRHKLAQQVSPGQETGEDDDSWLEGCF